MLAGSHRNAWPDETGTGGRTNRNTHRTGLIKNVDQFSMQIWGGSGSLLGAIQHHGGSWEYNFSYFLRSRLQISTDEEITKLAIANQRRANELIELKLLAEKYDFRIRDNRDKGGALWIDKPAGFPYELSSLLRSKGFVWSEKAESFYKTSLG